MFHVERKTNGLSGSLPQVLTILVHCQYISHLTLIILGLSEQLVVETGQIYGLLFHYYYLVTYDGFGPG